MTCRTSALPAPGPPLLRSGLNGLHCAPPLCPFLLPVRTCRAQVLPASMPGSAPLPPQKSAWIGCLLHEPCLPGLLAHAPVHTARPVQVSAQAQGKGHYSCPVTGLTACTASCLCSIVMLRSRVHARTDCTNDQATSQTEHVTQVDIAW